MTDGRLDRVLEELQGGLDRLTVALKKSCIRCDKKADCLAGRASEVNAREMVAECRMGKTDCVWRDGDRCAYCGQPYLAVPWGCAYNYDGECWVKKPICEPE